MTQTNSARGRQVEMDTATIPSTQAMVNWEKRLPTQVTTIGPCDPDVRTHSMVGFPC